MLFVPSVVFPFSVYVDHKACGERGEVSLSC